MYMIWMSCFHGEFIYYLICSLSLAHHHSFLNFSHSKRFQNAIKKMQQLCRMEFDHLLGQQVDQITVCHSQKTLAFKPIAPPPFCWTHSVAQHICELTSHQWSVTQPVAVPPHKTCDSQKHLWSISRNLCIQSMFTLYMCEFGVEREERDKVKTVLTHNLMKWTEQKKKNNGRIASICETTHLQFCKL